ncbi:MAG: putative branched chain amino acid transporter ATP-binding protein [Aeromicrobium sp.]|nr:putative branched chain amino acid transporter ATP-binding protein [Aeromicrobium sp.]
MFVGEIFRFVLLGVGAGSLYVLLASGLVLVYRGSGVINFAHGAMGMVGTYVWWELRQHHGAPFAVALVAGVASSGVLGVATHFLIMRPLRNASGLSKIIATLGVLVVLQSLAVLRYPSQVIVVSSSLPRTPVRIFGQAVGKDQLIILAIVTCLIIVLWAVYRFSTFGLATSAVAENPHAASAVGLSPNMVAAVNWAAGAGLAALAGILLAPISGLQAAGLTLLVVPALTAAMFGGLSSFPLMMAGGLILGIAQSLTVRYVTAPGWGSTIPFLFMLAMMVFRGRGIQIRGAVSARFASIGSGRVRPAVVVGATLACAAAVYWWLDSGWIDALTVQVSLGIIVLSLVVLIGYAGQLSLAQLTFAGIGTLVAARLVAELHLPFLLALLIALVSVIPLGLLIGLTGVRTRGVNLAILTFLLAVAVDGLVFSNTQFLGGHPVTKVGAVSIAGIDVGGIAHPERYAMVVVIAFVLTALAVANLRRGRVGRRLIAMRANERGTAALGIEVRNMKLYAFALSAVIASLGGILSSFRNPNVSYGGFSAFGSVYLVQNAVVGGVGWISGPLLGASLSTGALGTRLSTHIGGDASKYVPLVGGLLLLVIVIFGQDGLAAMTAKSLAPVRRIIIRRSEPAHTPVSEPPHKAARVSFAVASKSLEITDLTVRYGGVTALETVSLTVRPGEIVGLIGPNGAGKTTLIDAVTGFTSASGRVLLGGNDISGLRPAARQRLGLCRSFQSLELFDDMTVLDNLRVASDVTRPHHYITDLAHPGNAPMSAAAFATVEEFKLSSDLQSYPGELSYGKRRLVAIARAVACAPSVLLLDEPAAGLDDVECRELGELLERLSRQLGMGVLLIEHHVEMVLRHSDRVHVLCSGQTLASGSPEEIRNNAEVRLAYLGDVREDDDAEYATSAIGSV